MKPTKSTFQHTIKDFERGFFSGPFISHLSHAYAFEFWIFVCVNTVFVSLHFISCCSPFFPSDHRLNSFRFFSICILVHIYFKLLSWTLYSGILDDTSFSAVVVVAAFRSYKKKGLK